MRICPNCGAQIGEGKKFCASCGTKIEEVPQSPPPQQPYAPQQQQPYEPPPQQQQQQFYAQPPPPYEQQAYVPPYAPPPAFLRPKKSKLPFVIAGGGVCVVALVVVLIATNVFGLIKKGGGSLENDLNSIDSNGDASIYAVFGDGNLIKTPERLTANSSPEDGLSTAALVGPWQGNRSSIKTEYGFSDDGWFYKNVMITHSHLNSIYNPGYYSGDYYYYGYWTYNTTYTYTYLDTLIGDYTVKGGVIKFAHVVAIPRHTFEDDWYFADTRSVPMEALQTQATSARFEDDMYIEFEFIAPDRIRFRDENDDMDLFWDIRDDPHDVPVPSHQIPPVDWPKKALSPDMPEFATRGRYREASLSYSGSDKNIKPEFMTVTVVADKAAALNEIDAYGRALRGAGWWVNEYELGSEDTYLSYEARKGMFKLYLSNGRGSGTSADTVVIESTKYQEGTWAKEWTAATLDKPDGSVMVGLFEIETGVDINVYETIIFDKVDDAGAAAYKNKLVKAGFKKPQYSSDDWDVMKYIRIGKELYLARVELSKRMDSLSSFLYRLEYVADGVWPDSWTESGLPPPEGYDTIAGEIDKESWDGRMAEYSSTSIYVKYLGLDKVGVNAYFAKLKALGFAPVKDWQGNEKDEIYNYIRIEGYMIRVEINLMENEDITELRYEFNCYEDGVWPADWLAGGLVLPDKYECIVGAIDLESWRKNIFENSWSSSSSVYIKYLGMSETDATNYITKLKKAGFAPIKDWQGNDTDDLYNFIRIDGALFRIQIERRQNYELTEFYYNFQYYEDGVWPAEWLAGGLVLPDKYEAIVGAIDLEKWRENIFENSWSSSSSVYIKYLGMSETDATNYQTKLKKAGFAPIKDWQGNETDDLYGYLRIDDSLFRIQVEHRQNYELTEFYYNFQYYEDGVWPAEWLAGGIPAPVCTAIVGEIDMQEFADRLASWGYSARIKLLGANLATYAATLRTSGFTEREDSDWFTYDYWEFSKRVMISGTWCKVSIEEKTNTEIPEISISINAE